MPVRVESYLFNFCQIKVLVGDVRTGNKENMIRLAQLLLLFGSLPNFANSQVPPGFKTLFNGKDLKQWHTSRTSHQGTVADFYVEDGAITLKQRPYGQGGVLLTNKKFRDFELYVEVKIDSFCNGGIFLRSTESGQAYQIELSMPGGTGSLFGEAMQISKAAEAKEIAKVWKPGGLELWSG